MNCADAKARLEAAQPNELARDQQLLAHLQGCEQCRDFAEELRLSRLLRTLPVAPASEGFADRALARAWATSHPARAKSSPPYGWIGMAASVLLAVVILFTQFDDSPPQPGGLADALPLMQVVQVEPNEVRPVTLRLVSKDALPEATVTIHLNGVALDGYPNQDTLTWQTAISAGSNHLSLPVELLSREDGNILIEIKSGNAKKQMQLAVKARPLPQA